MAAERVDRPVIIPAPVDVTGAALVAPHVAEFGIEHGLACLTPRCLEIPLGAGVGAVARPLDARLPTPARQVVVPGVEISVRMSAAAAWRIVLDQSSRVQRFCERVVARDARPRLRQAPLRVAFLC